MTENNGISAQFFHTIGHPGVWTTTSVTKMAPTKVHRTLRLTRNEVDFVACRNYKISILPGFPFTIPIIIRAIFPSDGFSRLQRKRIKKKKTENFSLPIGLIVWLQHDWRSNAWMQNACAAAGRAIWTEIAFHSGYLRVLSSLSTQCSPTNLFLSTFVCVCFFSPRRHEVHARHLLYSFIRKHLSKRNVYV